MFKRSWFNLLKILFLLILLTKSHAVLQASILNTDQYRFDRLGLRQGLSQSTTTAVLQDSRGFIWIGTQDGLNRYDGYDFKIYRYDRKDPGSLSHNVVFSLTEDRKGNLWVGTFNKGLCLYDRFKDSFSNYINNPDDPASLSNNVVTDVFEDSKGALWVCTQNGLNLLNTESMAFTHFFADNADPHSLSNSWITAIAEDQDGVLWIGTNLGLNSYDRTTGIFEAYYHNSDDRFSLIGDTITSITVDSKNRIWIGTLSGLSVYEKDKKQFANLTHSSTNRSSLSHNIIRDVLQDKEGNIWVATDYGLNIMKKGESHFTRLFFNPDDPYSLSTDMILQLYQDHSDVIWVGTQIGGLNKFDPGKQKFDLLSFSTVRPNHLKDPSVYAVFEDSDGNVWVGTGNSLLHKWDITTGQLQVIAMEPAGSTNNNVRAIFEDSLGRFWIGTQLTGLYLMNRVSGDVANFRNIPGEPTSLSSDFVRSIVEDKQGRIWISTSGGGLNLLNEDGRTFTRFMNEPDNNTSLSSNFCRIIFEDSTEKLWVCTNGGGLNCFDRMTGEFKRFKSDFRDSNSLSSDYIFSIFEDHQGTLWIGTFGGGLCSYNPEKNQFRTFAIGDGLPNNVVYGILEDSSNHLWLSTNNGLSCFDPVTETFTNYGVDDGLQSEEFNGGAYIKDRFGRMYFGGVNGLNVFNPAKIKNNTHIPPVVITDFQVFNSSMPIGEHSVLKQHINETNSIELPYWDKSFSFRFAALDFRSPEKNRYRYKMEGFDKHWVEAGTRNFVTYTNLGSGDYIFRVLGSNNDGVWGSEGKSIRITILPPPWKTWWFMTLAGLVIILLCLLWYRRNAREVQMKTMIQTAHNTQMSIMPESDPEMKSFEISGLCLPTYEVSGDFYDYIWLEEGQRLGMVIGDMSGKGMKAAMNALMTNGMIYSELSMNSSLSEVMELVNVPVYRKTDKNTFAALALISLDENSREVRFVNAGLTEPLLVSKGKGQFIKGEGSRLPLGVLPENSYSEKVLMMSPGDCLLFFTDGVTESRNHSKGFYGGDSLQEFVSSLESTLSAEEILNAVIQDIRRHTGNDHQHDDITLLVVKAI